MIETRSLFRHLTADNGANGHQSASWLRLGLIRLAAQHRLQQVANADGADEAGVFIEESDRSGVGAVHRQHHGA